MNLKHSFSFVLGVVTCAAILIPIALIEIANEHELGRNNGYIDGLVKASISIEKEFGKIDGRSKNYKSLFSIKATEVVMVEENGIKTIRVNN